MENHVTAAAIAIVGGRGEGRREEEGGREGRGGRVEGLGYHKRRENGFTKA